MKATTGLKQDRLELKKTGEVQDKVPLNVVTNTTNSLDIDTIFILNKTEFSRDLSGFKKLITNGNILWSSDNYIDIETNNYDVLNLQITGTNKTRINRNVNKNIVINSIICSDKNLELNYDYSIGLMTINNIKGNINILSFRCYKNETNVKYNLFNIKPDNIKKVEDYTIHNNKPICVFNKKFKKEWIARGVPDREDLFITKEENDELFS